MQGCVGTSVSANASLLHPYGKNFVSNAAPQNVFGTIGDAVQVLQACGVPNGVGFDNTCNGS